MFGDSTSHGEKDLWSIHSSNTTNFWAFGPIAWIVSFSLFPKSYYFHQYIHPQLKSCFQKFLITTFTSMLEFTLSCWLPVRAKGVKRNPNLSERLKVHALARAGVAGLVPLEIYFNQSLCLQSKLI